MKPCEGCRELALKRDQSERARDALARRVESLENSAKHDWRAREHWRERATKTERRVEELEGLLRRILAVTESSAVVWRNPVMNDARAALAPRDEARDDLAVGCVSRACEHRPPCLLARDEAQPSLHVCGCGQVPCVCVPTRDEGPRELDYSGTPLAVGDPRDDRRDEARCGCGALADHYGHDLKCPDRK